MKEQYWSKVLLFGEYSMIFDSTALVIPLKRYSAVWSDLPDEMRSYSIRELFRFCDYLQSEADLAEVIDTDAMKEDLNKGWHLFSDIPLGYGLGSSGAVTAAVYDRYGKTKIQDMMRLKQLFSRMESYFHGSSSGIDPLQCFLGEPFRISAEGVEVLSDDFLFQGIEIFLIDTKQHSDTKPLVEYFKLQRENESYRTGFEKEYLPLVSGCMNALMDAEKEAFFPMLNRLSAMQMKYLRPMIPDSTADLFQCSCDFHFGVKILGAGGGGCMLGFTDDRKKTASFLKERSVLWLNDPVAED